MLAGRLRYLLEVYRPTTTAGKFGSGVTTYTLVNTIHAERVKLNGRRVEQVGEHFADYSARYNINFAHDVGENWRVREVGGNTYTVVAVEPNIERGMKTLICERLND